MHLTRGSSAQRPLTSGPRAWLAGQPHFVASHGLASSARSPSGGNKESKAGSRWKPESMATRCHTRFLRPKPDAHRMYAQDQVVIHTVRM
jgi:hypothetical protein